MVGVSLSVPLIAATFLSVSASCVRVQQRLGSISTVIPGGLMQTLFICDALSVLFV